MGIFKLSILIAVILSSVASGGLEQSQTDDSGCVATDQVPCTCNGGDSPQEVLWWFQGKLLVIWAMHTRYCIARKSVSPNIAAVGTGCSHSASKRCQ